MLVQFAAIIDKFWLPEEGGEIPNPRVVLLNIGEESEEVI